MKIRLNQIQIQKIEQGYTVEFCELRESYSASGANQIYPTETHHAKDFTEVNTICNKLSARLKSIKECYDEVTNR